MKTSLSFAIAGAALAGLLGAGALTAATMWIGASDWAAQHNASETWFEHIQHLTLLAAAIVCAVRSRHASRWLWLAGALFFLLLLGEELNWGQSLFHYATPETVAAVNAHGELSLHNMYGLIDWSKKIGLAIFAGFFGIAGLILAAAAPRRLPPFILCLALFAASIMILAAGRMAGHGPEILFGIDETSEGLLYLSVLGGLALLPPGSLKLLPDLLRTALRLTRPPGGAEAA